MTKKTIKNKKTKDIKKISKIKSSPKLLNREKVELISYTLTAVIPHARYGNLQPSITVKATTLEEAKNFIYPHIEELMSKYQEDQFGKIKFIPGKITNIKEVKKEKIVEEKEIVKNNIPTNEDKVKIEKPLPSNEEIPVSESFQKAHNAINGSMSLDAMNIIKNRLEQSFKLTDIEKDKLWIEFNTKFKELTNGI